MTAAAWCFAAIIFPVNALLVHKVLQKRAQAREMLGFGFFMPAAKMRVRYTSKLNRHFFLAAAPFGTEPQGLVAARNRVGNG